MYGTGRDPFSQVCTPLILALRRQMDLCEFEVSLVYRMSSWTAMATQRYPVSKTEGKKREKEKKLFSKVCCHSLSSQHLEGGGRKIRSSKPSWAIGD